MNPAQVGTLLAQGRAREALELAAAGARQFPGNAAWLHVLGAAQHAAGASRDAVETLRNAVALTPSDALVWNTLGAVLVDLGELDQGDASLAEAIRLHPEYREALFNRGIAARKAGRLEDAKTRLAAITQRWPEFDAARLELASVMIENQEAAAALEVLAPLLASHANDPRVLANAAAAHQRLGETDRAAAMCRQALAHSRAGPREVAAIAYTLAQCGFEDDASAAAARAAALAPDSAEIRALSGDALMAAGRPAAAAAHFAIAARTHRDAKSLAKLGVASLNAGDSSRAAEAFRDQLSLEPDSRAAIENLVAALMHLRSYDEAAQVLSRAVEMGHRDADMLSTLTLAKGMVCDWDGLDEITAELRRTALDSDQHPPIPQSGLYLEAVTAAEQRAWAEQFCRRRFGSAVPVQRAEFQRMGPLSIGYLSADFYEHAVAFLLVGLLEHHDPARVRVFAYSAGPDYDSPTRRRIGQAVHRFVDVSKLSPRAAAQRIAADRIDILLDLGGHVRDARLQIAAHRPAPVQGHFLGYAGTTGAPFLDFFVADALTVPPGQESTFSERVLRMPHSYQPNDPGRGPPCAMSRADAGLPDAGLVMCSFTQTVKIRPATFERWCELLHALPESVLWLQDYGASAVRRLRAFATARGIDPARLIFAPFVSQADHIARLALADIAIDTFPYGSHTTASDALWAGVPLITTRGETFASRVSASVLAAAGMRDWTFDDPDEASHAILEMARDRKRLAEARRRVANARGHCALHDAHRFARDFEDLLEEAARLAGG